MLSPSNGRHMDILEELEKKDKELTVCYSVLQLQEQTIKDMSEQIKHLEQLLMHTPIILNKQD